MNSTHTRSTTIPDRIYFRIGEVSSLVGVDPHVLRYWETEFTVIKPRRAKSKQRLYRKKDVENLLLIKSLLHDEGYTIAGARRLLKGPANNHQPVVSTNKKIRGQQKRIDLIKEELQSILQYLA